MQVGTLGDIAFEVSDTAVRTIRDWSWKGASSYTTHNRHLNKGLVEYTGSSPDTITFTMRVGKHLGYDPNTVITRLRQYEVKGIAVKFVLGRQSLGHYRWIVDSHTVKGEVYDKKGNVTGVDISVTLKEYLRG